MNQNNRNKRASTYMIILFIVIQLFSGIVPLYFLDTVGIHAILISQMLFFALGAIGMIIIENKYKMSFSFEEPFQSNIKSIFIWGILGLFIAIFAQNIAAGIQENLLGTPVSSENTQRLVEIVRSYPVFIIVIGIAGPIMEEFVFRKAIFGTLIEKIGGVGAAVVSSLIFAFIHFDGLLLVYSSMGFVFSWLYFKTKNIWAPIIAHCLMNSIAVLANLYLL